LLKYFRINIPMYYDICKREQRRLNLQREGVALLLITKFAFCLRRVASPQPFTIMIIAFETVMGSRSLAALGGRSLSAMLSLTGDTCLTNTVSQCRGTAFAYRQEESVFWCKNSVRSSMVTFLHKGKPDKGTDACYMDFCELDSPISSEVYWANYDCSDIPEISRCFTTST
jgi:hypothetical protein